MEKKNVFLTTRFNLDQLKFGINTSYKMDTVWTLDPQHQTIDSYFITQFIHVNVALSLLLLISIALIPWDSTKTNILLSYTKTD